MQTESPAQGDGRKNSFAFRVPMKQLYGPFAALSRDPISLLFAAGLSQTTVDPLSVARS